MCTCCLLHRVGTTGIFCGPSTRCIDCHGNHDAVHCWSLHMVPAAAIQGTFVITGYTLKRAVLHRYKVCTALDSAGLFY